jgi:hypothetical protein
MLSRLLALAVIAAVLPGCSAKSADGVLREGTWGGEHVQLVARGGQGAELEFDCAHASVPGALELNDSGDFSWSGVWVREHGGPVREGEPPDAHPAIFAGRVRGDRMTLTVRLEDDGSEQGSFELVYGRTGTVYKCL